MSIQNNGFSAQPPNAHPLRPADAGDVFQYQPDAITDGDPDPGGLPPFDPSSPARLEEGDVFHFQPDGIVDGDPDPGELPPFDPVGPDSAALLGEYGLISGETRQARADDDTDIPDCIIWVIDGANVLPDNAGDDLSALAWDLLG
ncbi:hypothetical protein Q5Y75_17100 [Ruegeria sp. 2205SS24-7]|uniref:hypothetical protein n=1 Tax=Ruegeria discodermiae TaxID=3064389 RepID=UPI00274124ED|nr:hypothetical protein [Ruegeria sp. 2205SS24-7]MDP5218940.1 hypothetical protein [Ruegeria sp. 2205SS24-7]